MAKVISISGIKGGTGKSTVAINLSGFLADHGYDTLLIDADPQGSVLRWKSSIAEGRNLKFEVTSIPTPTLHEEVPNISRKYDFIIIDCPPGNIDIIRSCLLASHLAIVPVQPSPLDFWTAPEVISLVKEARKTNRKLKAKLLISRKIVGTTLATEAPEALREADFDIFRSEISQRIDFAKSILGGKRFIEYHPVGRAADELKSFAREVLDEFKT